MKTWRWIMIGGLSLTLLGPACSSNPLAEGQRLMAAGEYDKAAESFKAVRDQHPDDAKILNELGLAYAKQEKWNDAIPAYQKALELNPAFPEAHFNLATVYLRVHSLPEAEAEFRLAISNRGDYAKAYNNLGLTLMSIGKFDEAETNFKKAIELEPDNALYKENLEYNQALGKATKENVKKYLEDKKQEQEKKTPAAKPAPAPKK